MPDLDLIKQGEQGVVRGVFRPVRCVCYIIPEIGDHRARIHAGDGINHPPAKLGLFRLETRQIGRVITRSINRTSDRRKIIL